MKHPTLWLVAVTCILLTGCGPDHAWSDYGEGNGTESELCDGRVFLVLAPKESWGSSSTGTAPGPKCSSHGKWLLPDGRREITWSCSTRDGIAGKVTVDGQRFDLTKGGLFLVSTNNNATKVEQLAVDMSQFHGVSATESLRTLADKEARIAEFLKKSPAQ